MKTIAISIDEATLTGLDRLARSAEEPGRSTRGSGRRGKRGGNRSRIVRQALKEFLQRRESQQRDGKEKRIHSKHRRLVTRQAEALVGEQVETRTGEIWMTREKLPERVSKPGFDVVVSRQFIAENPRTSTVVCAPVYIEIPGISTEVVIGQNAGLPRASAVRCDFLALMFKRKLSTFVGSLSPFQIEELNRALAVSLDFPPAP